MSIRKRISFNHTHSPICLGDPSGQFSVRSVYSNLQREHTSCYTSLKGETSDPSQMKSFWRKLWRIQVQSKVKIFLWRLHYNFLLVAVNLRKRGCEVTNNFYFCHFPDETSTHVLLYCWWARAIWNALGFSYWINLAQFENMGEWMWFCFSTYSNTQLPFICFGVRMIICNCRNFIAHNLDGMCPTFAAKITLQKVENYIKQEFKFHIYTEECSTTWQSPKSNFIKINCDGSWLSDVNAGGFGCIAINSDQIVLGVRSSFKDGLTSALEAEGVSILEALRWAVLEG